MGSTEPVWICRDCIPDRHSAYWRDALSLIAAIGLVGALSAFLPVLQGPDSDRRSEVVDSLSTAGKSRIEQVTDLLWCAGWRAREGVLDALEKIGEEAVPELTRVARVHPRIDTRRLAVVKLGEIGGRSARDSLVSLLDTDDKDIVLKSLGMIGDRSTGSMAGQFLDDSRVEVRRRALITLGLVSGVEEAERIISGLSDTHHSVRSATAGVLEKMGVPACSLILDRLDRMPDRAKFHAIRILGDLRYEPAMDTLVAALNYEVWWIRAVIVRALGHLDARAAGVALENHLKDEHHPFVRSTLESVLAEVTH